MGRHLPRIMKASLRYSLLITLLRLPSLLQIHHIPTAHPQPIHISLTTPQYRIPQILLTTPPNHTTLQILRAHRYRRQKRPQPTLPRQNKHIPQASPHYGLILPRKRLPLLPHQNPRRLHMSRGWS